MDFLVAGRAFPFNKSSALEQDTGKRRGQITLPDQSRTRRLAHTRQLNTPNVIASF